MPLHWPQRPLRPKRSQNAPWTPRARGLVSGQAGRVRRSAALWPPGARGRMVGCLSGWLICGSVVKLNAEEPDAGPPVPGPVSAKKTLIPSVRASHQHACVVRDTASHMSCADCQPCASHVFRVARWPVAVRATSRRGGTSSAPGGGLRNKHSSAVPGLHARQIGIRRAHAHDPSPRTLQC